MEIRWTRLLVCPMPGRANAADSSDITLIQTDDDHDRGAIALDGEYRRYGSAV